MPIPNNRPVRLLYLVNEDQPFYTHRLPLARAALAEGYEVILATRITRYEDALRETGIQIVPLGMQRTGRNPLNELRTIFDLYRTYRHIKPDLVHQVTLKPVLYGSVVARLCGVPAVVNAIAGFGYVFISNSQLAKLLRPIFSLSFRFLLNGKAVLTILQNDDDRALLSQMGVNTDTKVRMVRGSGVNIENYPTLPEPDGIITIGLVSRLLRHKGIIELVEAARLLKKRGIPCRVVLIGDPDPMNPASCSDQDVQAWVNDGIVEAWGYRPDIAAVWAQCHIAVLPSYREGLPKALLEAASCGRPLVATDVPGCRDVVRDNENGFLVPVRRSEELADALEKLVLSRDLRTRFGARAREIVEQEYTDVLVARQTLEIYREALSLSE